jgi:hypothetical protein
VTGGSVVATPPPSIDRVFYAIWLQRGDNNMNYTRRQNTEYVRARIESQIEEGQRILEVTSLPSPEDIQAYQERTCEWRVATYALLEEIYDHQSIQSAYCPSVEKFDLELEMRNEARDKLKAEVSKILDSLRDLI